VLAIKPRLVAVLVGITVRLHITDEAPRTSSHPSEHWGLVSNEYPAIVVLESRFQPMECRIRLDPKRAISNSIRRTQVHEVVSAGTVKQLPVDTLTT